jgi:hypothetical protein
LTCRRRFGRSLVTNVHVGVRNTAILEDLQSVDGPVGFREGLRVVGDILIAGGSESGA